MIPKLGSFSVLFLFVAIILSPLFIQQDTSVSAGGNPDVDNIGWRLLDNNTVLHIWNTNDNYYFNVSSGIQITNHYNEYWSHNVLMLGYYTSGNWNLIYRTDELSGFNRDIDTDDSTYVNATIWKNLSYNSYDFRLAIRYHLGVNDTELTITPYIKNLGIAIPYQIGFGWEIKDIQIDMTEANDQIRINNTRYLLNQSLNNSYTNLSMSEDDMYGNITGWTDPVFYLEQINEPKPAQFLYLKWDKNLTYKVTVKSRSGQYNAPVTLFIKVGTLSVGQEKSTEMFWYDAEGDYVSSFDISTNTTEGRGICNNDTHLFIADSSGAHNIDIYNLSGTYINSWDVSGNVSDVYGGVGTDGNNVWIASSADFEVYVYDMTGTYTETHWDCSGHGADISGLTTDGSNIYILSNGGKVVNKYAMDGTYISQWSTTVANANPYDITTDGINIWVIDPADEEAYKYDMNGNYDSSWDTSAQTTSWDTFGITVIPGDYFYVSDRISDEVWKYEAPSAPPSNNAPTQTGEVPANTSTGISTTPSLYVKCVDNDADNMNATWWSNSSGSWVQFASNESAGGFANNTNITQSFTNASSHATKYYWSVNLTDSTDWCNDTYHFTTESQSLSFTVVTPSSGDYLHFNDWAISNPGFGLTTQYNVSEDNQTGSVPSLNITNTGNVALNFSMNWTSTPGTGIDMKWATSDSAPNPGVADIATDPSTTQIVTNLGIGAYEQIWLWLDFVSVTEQTSQQNIKIWSTLYT